MLPLIRKLFSLLFGKKEGNYNYIIEIRPTFEKWLLKNIIFNTNIKGIYTQTPHITLVYNFKPKTNSYKIAKIIKETLNGKYIEFMYDGYDIFKGNNGYVVAFKVIPSNDFIAFQKGLYNKLKPYIKKDSNKNKYNKNPHFHCTIAYKVKDLNHIKLPDKEIYLKSHILRVTLLRSGKIVYEYDVPTNKILDRKKALSKEQYKKTLLKFRRNKLKVPLYNDNIYLISDTHFNHENIIKYCARPFANIKEMNKEIINYWNSVIAPYDKVYFLGDFAFRNGGEILNKLNGEITFIKGNHDKKGEQYKIIERNGYKFLLSHYPNPDIEFDGWVIHGHVHNNNLKKYPFINPRKKRINVSIEVLNYHPISLDFLLDLIDQNKKILTIEEII